MSELLVAGILGALGGFIRSVIGVMKSFAAKREIRWRYWLATVVIGAFVGVLAGVAFDFDAKICVLAGYAGTDGLEGIWKSVKKK